MNRAPTLGIMVILIQLFLLLFIIAILAYEVMLFIELIRLSRGDVPYVPSTTEVIRAVIAANVLPRDGMILDLGCGDGKALRMLAAAGYRGPLIGYERAPFPWALARMLCRFNRVSVTIHRRNFRDAPLEQARGLYLFLMEQPLADIASMLASRLPPGIPVVSAEFKIADWTPEHTLTAKGVTSKQAKIYVYRTGMLSSSAL